MNWERERASRLGYESPVQDTKDLTDKCYNDCARMLIENYPDVHLMIASHNEVCC